MGISPELLTIGQIIFPSNLLLLLKFRAFQNSPQSGFRPFLENFVYPQAVTCLAHQYELRDWFSRLKMKIFHPVSFRCLARYFNSSNKLLEKMICPIIKSSGDMPTRFSKVMHSPHKTYEKLMTKVIE